MNILTILPLVNWGMGVAIISVFALVCVVLSVLVYNMANSDSLSSINTK